MAGRRKKKSTLKNILLMSVFVVIVVLGLYFYSEYSKKTTNVHKFKQDKVEDYSVMVCIDAGHGGHDGGSTAYGRNEKDDTLKLALEVKEELHKLGIGVYLTRGDDTYISPRDRVKIAESQDVKMLFSIHRNAYSGEKDVNGVEVWIHSSKPEDALNLSNDLLNNIEAIGHMSIRGMRYGTSENPNENYTINTSKLTSCILEMGYITSKKDNEYYDKDLKANARAIANAIEKAVKK